ncbi:cytochrome c-type biogenesis protein [Bradyrhizobium sp.]|uniref:cytochrome c-type biogenesis protein n=1 Tax=Bradyrhizobium sp. TaxID=376 RepID=UPI003C72074B
MHPLEPKIICLSAIFALSLAAVPAWAVMPDEILRDPVVESRARALSQELRCVVCQNQSIDDSNAPLARDLRILLRDRLASGDTDQQALEFIVQRYGNFVLLKPPMQLSTLLLWIGPFAVLLVAGVSFWRYLTGSRNRSETAEAPAPLSEMERMRVEAILKERRPA